MGFAIGRALARHGYQLLFTYRSSQKAVLSYVEQLHAESVVASAVFCDMTRPASIRSLVRRLEKDHMRVTLLVNLASIYERSSGKLADLEKEWTVNLAANAQGGYLLSKRLAPLMRRSGGGGIIHFCDWTAASGRPRYKDYGPYYIGKVAVKGLVEALALELAPQIQVNAVAPGPILPPPGMSKKERYAVEKATPLGRWGGIDEIVKTVVFIAESKFITGEILRVDGGRHLL